MVQDTDGKGLFPYTRDYVNSWLVLNQGSPEGDGKFGRICRMCHKNFGNSWRAFENHVMLVHQHELQNERYGEGLYLSEREFFNEKKLKRDGIIEEQGPKFWYSLNCDTSICKSCKKSFYKPLPKNHRCVPQTHPEIVQKTREKKKRDANRHIVKRKFKLKYPESNLSGKWLPIKTKNGMDHVRCPICLNAFKDFDAGHNHFRTKHGVCSVCSKTFISYFEVIEHIIDDHPEQLKSRAERRTAEAEIEASAMTIEETETPASEVAEVEGTEKETESAVSGEIETTPTTTTADTETEQETATSETKTSTAEVETQPTEDIESSATTALTETTAAVSEAAEAATMSTS